MDRVCFAHRPVIGGRSPPYKNLRYMNKLRYTIYDIRRTRHGFTLVELLLALSVAGIVLAAVATLAFALSSAASSSDDTAREQAELRYTTLRVTELLRNCRLICATSDSDLAVWQSDDDSDSQIDVNELTYIQKGSASNYLRLCQFPSSATGTVALGTILSPDDYTDTTYVNLIPQCSNVQFILRDENGADSTVSPPLTKFVSVTFNLTENGVSHQYQISTALRCWAGNLLNSTATAIVSDDD